MYISIELAKKHLNLEDDFCDDDEYIAGLIQTAEQSVERDVCEKLKDLETCGGQLPAPLIQAQLLLIGHYYQNREIVGGKTQSLPINYKYLIDLYRNYNN